MSDETAAKLIDAGTLKEWAEFPCDDQGLGCIMHSEPTECDRAQLSRALLAARREIASANASREHLSLRLDFVGQLNHYGRTCDDVGVEGVSEAGCSMCYSAVTRDHEEALAAEARCAALRTNYQWEHAERERIAGVLAEQAARIEKLKAALREIGQYAAEDMDYAILNTVKQALAGLPGKGSGD